jgi:two-component system sensor histidine kinase CiaH
MMHSAAVRLTLFYLAIIMALSIGFSILIYRVSAHEIDRNLTPKGFPQVFVQGGTFSGDDFQAYRDERLLEGRENLRNNLILLNVGTLVLGAMLSYGLARRTLEPIEQAFEAQGRFTADASHELRTPLTAMQTTIEVGLRNPKLTLPQAKELLDGTLDEVKKLSALSNGLLKLTRNNGQDMPKQPVSLKEISSQAIGQLELAAKNKGMKLENKIDDVKVMGDDVSLKELTVILLDNAIKYGTKKTTVTITGGARGKYAELSVADQGPGMKAVDVEHIFDRFYRAESSRSRDHHVEGYGLGLSIAQKIVDAHRGTIEVKSKLGEGSIFTARLPLTQENNAQG